MHPALLMAHGAPHPVESRSHATNAPRPHSSTCHATARRIGRYLGNMNDADPDSSAHANSPPPLLAGGALVGCGAGLLGAVLIPWALGNALTPAPLHWVLIAGISAIVAGTVVVRRGVRPPLTQRDRGLLLGAATVVALLVAGVWIGLAVARQDRGHTTAHVSPPSAAPQAAALPSHLVPTTRLGRAVALLPRDTTGLVVIPVASALSRDAVPREVLRQIGATTILAQAAACGVVPERDIEFILIAQRMHDLGSVATGRPSDARNVVLVAGQITRETVETCLTRAGQAATVQALGTGLVAITSSDTARAYQAEFGAPASVLANPLFARHLAAIPADTLAWGWMDHDAMRKALPDQLLPLSSLAVLRAMGGGVVRVSYRLSLEDEARARRVEREWTAYSANLPAGSLGSRIRYVRAGVNVQCSLMVTQDDMAEAATFLGAFVRAL